MPQFKRFLLNMRHSIISILVTLFLISNVGSQTIEPSSNVEKRVLQMEFETLYSVEQDTKQKNTSWSLPNVLLRYGLSDNVELQLHTPFTKERCFENNGLTSNVFEFSEVELGLSVNLWNQNRLLPEAAIMVRAISPTESFSFDTLGNMVSLNLSHSISQKVRLGYNLGTTTNMAQNTTGFFVLNIAYEPNARVHYFLENSTNFDIDAMKSNCLGLGVGFNLNANMAIDFSAANSLLHSMFYTGAILTWAIDTKKH